MSHRELQKALVIALHDPAYLDDLSGLELTADEKRQLLAVDRRAWLVDPLRRRRVLRVLSEELKVATTLALAETRSLAFAEAFFSSRFFRDAVAGRGSLVPAFGDYLAAQGLTHPWLPDVVRLETTTARCRRARDVDPAPGVSLTPGVAVAKFSAGVLEAMQRVERWLFELSLMPQAGLCADAPPLPELPPPGGELLLLFAPSATGVSLTTVDEDLFRVLTALSGPPRPRAAAEKALDVPRPAGLLDALVGEGLVVNVPDTIA